MPQVRATTILNVNDDDTSRYLTAKWLSRAGFSVRDATSGREALACAFAEQRPCLVVLDVRLPDIDGFEVCQRLKADPRTSSIPILLTSATFVTKDERVQGLDVGADAYLTQPYEPLELVATIRALLRARTAEDTARAAVRDWETTFEGIPDGVCVIDEDGRIRRYNRAFRALLGLPDAIAPGCLVEELIARIDAEAAEVIAWCLHGDGDARELRLEGRWLRVRASQILDGGGCVLLVKDEPPERRDGVRAAPVGEELLGLLAHDLSGPLRAIDMALRTQEEAGMLDDASARIRRAMRREVDQLTRFVDVLLEASRGER